MRFVQDLQLAKWILVIVPAFACTLPSSASAFVVISNGGKPAYWKNGDITYRFNTRSNGFFDGGHDFSGTMTDEFDPIRNAFDTWEHVPGLKLSIHEGGATTDPATSGDKKNTISWVPSNWRGLSFRPPINALAVTLLSFDSGSGEIVDADIYFNAEGFDWAVVDDLSKEGDYVDVQNIATHEIGHLLGLDHSSESIFESESELADATMYFASSSGETSRRDLKSDDLDGIQSLYASIDTDAPSISSIDLEDDSFGALTFRLRGSNFQSQTSFVLTKNSNSVSDVVSRYKTIVSSSEAIVEFDVSTFPDGEAELLAFNRPTEVIGKSVTLSITGFEATSSGKGGGGCEIVERDFEISPFVPTLLVFLSLLFGLRSVRLRYVRSVSMEGPSPRKH